MGAFSSHAIAIAALQREFMQGYSYSSNARHSFLPLVDVITDLGRNKIAGYIYELLKGLNIAINSLSSRLCSVSG